MKHWSSREAADAYYRAEGFIPGKVVCQICGVENNGCIEPGLDVSLYLECANCGCMKAKFIPNPD